MRSPYVSARLRRLVFERAEGLCEYCLLPEEDSFFRSQVDHIVSTKHDGPTEAENLALACLFCNRNKGSDIASLSPRTRELVRFFNPRNDRWGEHYRLGQDGITIIPLTDIGEATVRILGINEAERLLERDTLRAFGRYPSEAARRRLTDG